MATVDGLNASEPSGSNLLSMTTSLDAISEVKVLRDNYAAEYGNNGGAMINLVLCRTVYPGWACRYYVDATVPQPCVAYLRDNGADVRNMQDEYPGVGLFQRFLVMNDPAVGRFLVRDCDARLSTAGKPILSRNASIATNHSTWCATMCCTTSL